MRRRQFIKAAITTAVAAPPATVLYTLFVEPHWLQLTTPRLNLPGLPMNLAGLRIAHLTDLHIGARVSDSYLVESFRQVTAREPDIVVFTGDFISYDDARQMHQLSRVLREIPRGRLGTLGVLGNHDYGHRWRMLDVAGRVADIARDAGIAILRNESADVGGVKFFGVDDMWTPAFDPEVVLEHNGRDPADIVLCHNPDAADVAMWGRFGGWILSGHTHGGQCKPPFLPPPLLPVQNRLYTSGAFPLSGGRHMYISRGVGHLVKARFNARPEIPVYELVAGA